jgi:thiol-disulfide isomerase/thioredoxin
MRTRHLVFAAIAIAGTLAAQQPDGFHELKTGDAAPAFSLPGIDGKTWTLGDFKADVLMVYFTSNHCPVCHAAEPRLIKLVQDMKGRSFEVVAINPNNPAGLRVDELGYSKYDDSFERRTRDSRFPIFTTAKRSAPRWPTAALPRRMCSFSTKRASCATRDGWTTAGSPMHRS